MNIILKRAIVFTFITVSLSIFIAIVVPVKQKVMISLMPKDEMMYLNKEFINFDNLFIKKLEYFIKNYDQNSSNLDDIINKVLIQNNVEETFYKNPKLYFELIISELSINKIITKKEQRFFNNSTYISEVIINPEDGSASKTTPGIIYSGIEQFDRNEIIVLSKMISKKLSQTLNNKYKSELKDVIYSIENITIPFQLRVFDQNINLFENNIKELEKNKNQIDADRAIDILDSLNNETVKMLLRLSNKVTKSSLDVKYYRIQNLLSEIQVKIDRLEQLGSKKIQITSNISQLYAEKNRLKNMNIDFSDLKKSALEINEALISPNIIDYKRVQNYNTKSQVEEKIFYLLLIFLNIILFIIFIIFFRNGMTHFIKTHIEND
jgi:hypothetical protein